MVWTAFIIGLAGSLHCVGMCSPLVMAATARSPRLVRHRALYHAGRIITYAVLGGLMAAFGMVAVFSRFQFVLTLAVGVLMIGMGVSRTQMFRVPAVLARLNLYLKKMFAWSIGRQTSFAVFMTGMLNGLLPCGLTFAALSYCLTLAGPVDGMQFMLVFGLGTLPGILGATRVFDVLKSRRNFPLAAVSRYAFLLTGAVVLARLFITHHDAVATTARQVIILCK